MLIVDGIVMPRGDLREVAGNFYTEMYNSMMDLGRNGSEKLATNVTANCMSQVVYQESTASVVSAEEFYLDCSIESIYDPEGPNYFIANFVHSGPDRFSYINETPHTTRIVFLDGVKPEEDMSANNLYTTALENGNIVMAVVDSLDLE